jgi:MFS family permease
MWVDHMPSDKFMATIMSMQYFTTTLSAVIGPNVSGWIVQAGGNDYALIWPVSFGFMLVSVLLSFPIKFGEAHKEAEVTTTA